MYITVLSFFQNPVRLGQVTIENVIHVLFGVDGELEIYRKKGEGLGRTVFLKRDWVCLAERGEDCWSATANDVGIERVGACPVCRDRYIAATVTRQGITATFCTNCLHILGYEPTEEEDSAKE